MKNTWLTLLGLNLLTAPLAATAQQFGDFSYSSDGAAITITGYTGPGGAVNIPSTITDLPVTRIGDEAFRTRTSLTRITIPSSVTTIGDSAFHNCTSLSSVTIPESVTYIGIGAFEHCNSLTSVTIPASITSIEPGTFLDCGSLPNVTIPGSVTNIGHWAFAYSPSLKAVFFQGKAPSFGGTPFDHANPTVYYLPGTTGWGASFAGRPTLLWNPLMQTSAPALAWDPPDSASTSPGLRTSPSWWRPARTWPMPPGLHCKVLISPTARSTSAIPTGRITPPASTASARRRVFNSDLCQADHVPTLTA